MLCSPAAYAAAPAAPASSPFIPAGCGSIPKAPGYGPGTAMGVRKPAAMQENRFKLKPPRAFKKKKIVLIHPKMVTLTGRVGYFHGGWF